MGVERDWNAFWEEKSFKEGGVYGSPNEQLTEYAIDFLGQRTYPHVLDLACGDGRYTLPISSHASVVAMDISGRALDYLGRSPQGNHANIVREEADVFDVLSERRAYDLIICSGLIEELGETKQHILIESLKSWVHERGLMIFRYVTEKRLTPESATEVVVNHRELVNRFSNGGWHVEVEAEEKNFRQAQVGRVIDGVYVRRYFRPATLIVQKSE